MFDNATDMQKAERAQRERVWQVERHPTLDVTYNSLSERLDWTESGSDYRG